MNTLTVTSKDQFLEQLDEELHRKLPKQEAQRISHFSRHYLMHLPSKNYWTGSSTIPTVR